MKTALIDADSIIHIVSYHYQAPKVDLELDEDPEELIRLSYQSIDSSPVLAHVDSFINDILNKTCATHYLGFIGHRDGSWTFRHKLAKTKPYKGNRKSTPSWVRYWKPIIIEHMVSKWKFIELSNIEADDACAICQTHLENTVICSPDKDLKQVPGEHYDYKKMVFDATAYGDSIKILYSQVLVGDSTDNISGCPRVGEKSKLLEFPDCVSAQDFHEFVFNVFKTRGVPDMMEEQLALVYMLRDVDGIDLTKIPEPIERIKFGDSTESIIQEEVPEIEFPRIDTIDFTQS